MRSLLRTAACLARAPVVPARSRIVTMRGFASSGDGGGPVKTPLYDFHVSRGATMVEFAGHSLPAVYKDSTLSQSHLFTRSKASLFDVSHMVQHIISGSQAVNFLETVTPSEWGPMPLMKAKLTLLLWRNGGIVDDAVVTRLTEDKFYVVTNGACREKDINYLKAELERFPGRKSVDWRVLEGNAIVALQGPEAAKVLAEAVCPDEDGKSPIDFNTFWFSGAAWARLRLADGSASRQKVLINRGGYTGEDGFELSFGVDEDSKGGSASASSSDEAASVVEAMLRESGPERLRPAGLGARDSLRLEAGLCLYGQDLDDSTTPVEANLVFVMGKNRTGGFNGSEAIQPILKSPSNGGLGVTRRRVGLIVSGAPARAGTELFYKGRKVGTVTSGMPSPSLRVNIAMAYVEEGLQKLGTEFEAVVRGRKQLAVVTKMPFVPARYFKPPKVAKDKLGKKTTVN
ncbi:hypothetical protein CP532_5270 [Ophiocordyceps camponoti-leonardi (nom. inval.)]|nr:hypothetical protein CP532_5270 [Ophiocordyceps camponoti-leonardi (nom. inval.)]